MDFAVLLPPLYLSRCGSVGCAMAVGVAVSFFCCTCCHASATVAAIVTASVFIGVWGGSGSRTVECAQDFMVEGGF